MQLPVFLPDATVGVIRGVDSVDLKKLGVEGVVTSTYHHLVHQTDQELHQLMNWDGVILTDSGGWQVYSLLRENPKLGKVTEDGFIFNWNGHRINFTPEESIKLQLKLGADILICLDQCTDPDKPYQFQEEAVRITIEWARRCKTEFETSLRGAKRRGNLKKPQLYAVIQGGNHKELRKKCAEELIKVGFDGYCYGGVPIDSKKQFLKGILDYTAKLMPADKPKYALGVGTPENIMECFKMGYRIFDCVIPTREARHKRLYIWKSNKGLGYKTINLNSSINHQLSSISPFCDCHTCQNFSAGYLYHQFKIGDTLAYRLATIHNLRFYTQLMEKLKEM